MPICKQISAYDKHLGPTGNLLGNKSIKAKAIGIPDPDNAYVVKLKDKSAASQVELTNDGIIKAINTTSPIEKHLLLRLQIQPRNV